MAFDDSDIEQPECDWRAGENLPLPPERMVRLESLLTIFSDIDWHNNGIPGAGS
jgi:hypothetical protein